LTHGTHNSSFSPRLEGRVLVVDDTEATRYLTAHALRLAGMEVLEASTGQEGLEKAALSPDVVVLDVRLPDMSGFEVCRRLKENPVTAAIPVLYISALMRDDELVARLFEDGADGYIPQPVVPKHLVAQTWALVRMHRAEQARQHEREEAQAEQQRLQRELVESRLQVQRLAESGVVGLFTWNADGSILEANDSFLEMLGYTREELERGLLDWKRMTPPEWKEQDPQGFQELRRRGGGSLTQKQYFRKDGSRVDVLLGGAVFEGESHRGVTLVVDDTARREAERRSKQLLEELESSKARLRLALDAAGLGSWSYELATGAHHWDTRAKELFGLPPEAAVSMEVWRDGTAPEDRELVERAVRRALAGDQDGHFKAEYRTVGLQDGGVLRWLSARGRVMFGLDGRPGQFSGIWLDITERKLAEQRAADIQATTAAFSHALTAKQVGDALLEHGLESLDAYAGAVCVVEGPNLRMLSQFGYPENLVQEHAVFPLTAPTPSSVAASEGRTLWIQESEFLALEWPEFAQTIQGSQSRAWLSMPLKDGKRVIGVLGLSFSTPRRLGIQEKAHLESLCQLCAQALVRARLYEEERRAREETRLRAELEQQFLGMVSHDLRNPLMAISLGARSLQRMEPQRLEVLQRTAGRIATSADTMGRMVSDLLDFTRGRLGGGIPLERTVTDLMGLCREVIDEFSVTNPRIPIRLEGEARCEGRWDGPRMRQMLSNLLSNALRHANEGTAVTVRTRVLAGEVELSVSNEGLPIPAELMPVLFEPFRRGLERFRPAGSLGLGLYIVRQVVEGHGGRVEVRSGEEGTTCFTVRVPRGD
jgi:PAS domain S-box-containing protein